MRRLWLVPLALVALGLGASAPAWALQAGITLDVHQDIQDPALWPNDFHIEGLICSNDGVVPVVVQSINDLFGPNFTYTMTKMPGDDCWYWFEATWWLDQGQYIPYCRVIHLGILFDVDAANVVIDLIGWWTRDGLPVGGVIGGLNNSGYVPVVGFNVADVTSPQILTIGNGDLVITPPLPIPPISPPPWPPDDIELMIVQADVIPFPPGVPPPFEELWEGGAQQSWPWVPVTYLDGEPINPGRPLFWQVDSFFDIFLDVPAVPGPSNLGVAAPFPVEPGGFLVSRQRVGFQNNSGQYEERWFWEIHGAQEPEACCFPDGTCQNLLPFDCRQLGGQPMGLGTNCLFFICPQPDLGACCYATVAIQCVMTDQLTCEQGYLGVWMGAGTNCDDLNGNGVADICETGEMGACCYGTDVILCVIVDQSTCEQQLMGVWMGAGTNCDDLNGNGVADICEEPQQPEACCFEDGHCEMLPADLCLQMMGTPQGAGTFCLGDGNGNGIDDACEEPGGEYRFEFSLDIGSDKELSDPFADGDEAFDPGDVYWWQVPPVLPPGRDGFKDDKKIFGVDPWPDAPDFAVPPATRVPVGMGSPEMYSQFFDLDGHDQIDVMLHEEWNLHGQVIELPIPKWPSPCIFGPQFMFVSYDDDMKAGWPANDVPVTRPSPAGVSSYGSTAGRDEVVGIDLAVLPIPPLPINVQYRLLDEAGVHVSLPPNPDGIEQEDDDVDSLDIVISEDACPHWYFTADHEATYVFPTGLPLDPGDIYEVFPGGGFALVIDDVNNLGLPDYVDVDAFEFTWLEHPQYGPCLAVAFSVDNDDPLTPGNESGGLDPRVIYASFLTGSYFRLVEQPLMDDVDALTIWRESLQPPVWCLGDMNCSGGSPTFDDIKYFSAAIGSESNWWAYFIANQGFPPPCPWLLGDYNLPRNGVEFSDIKPFAASIGQPCIVYVP